MPVEFDNSWGARRTVEEDSPKMVSFLVSKGLVKDDAQARALLFILAGIFAAVALYLFVSQDGPRPEREGRTPVPQGIEVGGFSN